MLRRRLLIVLVALTVLPLTAAAGAASGTPPRIGGPSPFPVKELIPGVKPPEAFRHLGPQRSGPEVLLGVGHREQLEIVGYRAGKTTCIEIANRQIRSSSSGCGGSSAFLPPGERAIVVDGVDGTAVGKPRERFSQIEGSLSPAVAEVRLLYPYRGRIRQSRAVVARVRGPLLETLGLKRPFGTFAAPYHGCSSKVKVTAVGDSGEVLESTSPLHGLLHLHVPCSGSGGASAAVAAEPSDARH